MTIRTTPDLLTVAYITLGAASAIAELRKTNKATFSHFEGELNLYSSVIAHALLLDKLADGREDALSVPFADHVAYHFGADLIALSVTGHPSLNEVRSLARTLMATACGDPTYANASLIYLDDKINEVSELFALLTSVKDDTSQAFGAMDIPTWIDTIDVSRHPFKDTIEEYCAAIAFLNECKGAGEGVFWDGADCPEVAIRHSYFTQYAKRLANLDGFEPWPHNCIDWDAAAQELMGNYTPVHYDGILYYT